MIKTLRSIHALSGAYTAIPQEDDEPGAPAVSLDVSALLESSVFQACMGLMILLNSLCIGLEIDLADALPWDLIETVFLAVFVFELLLKVYSIGLQSFLKFGGPDFFWNLFDIFIVGAGVMDLSVQFFSGRSAGGVATMFRLVRLLRIMRLFRIVRYLKQVYFIVYGFIVATQAVAQVSLVMLFVLFISSVILAKTLGPAAEELHLEELHGQFSSVSRSMLTLFELMAVPDLRVLDANSLLLSRPHLLVFLVLYIVFGSFGMIALLTGVISESIFEKNALRIEEAKAEKEERDQVIVNTCSQIFDDMPQSEIGEVTRKDVELVLPRIAEMLDQSNADYTEQELVMLSSLMDTDCSDGIDKDEFTQTIMRHIEGVKPMSMQEMQYDVAWCKNKLGKIMTMLEELALLITPSDGSAVARETSGGGSARTSSIMERRKSQRISAVAAGRGLLPGLVLPLERQGSGSGFFAGGPLLEAASEATSFSEDKEKDAPAGDDGPSTEKAPKSSGRDHDSNKPCAAAAAMEPSNDMSNSVMMRLLEDIRSSISGLCTGQAGIAESLQRAGEAKDEKQMCTAKFHEDMLATRKKVEDVFVSCLASREVQLALQRDLANFRVEHLSSYAHIQSLQANLRRDLAEFRGQGLAFVGSAEAQRGEGGSPGGGGDGEPLGLRLKFEGTSSPAVGSSHGIPEPTLLPTPLDCLMRSVSPGTGATRCANEQCEATPQSLAAELSSSGGRETQSPDGRSLSDSPLVDELSREGDPYIRSNSFHVAGAGSSISCSTPPTASVSRDCGKVAVSPSAGSGGPSPVCSMAAGGDLCPELDRGEQ